MSNLVKNIQIELGLSDGVVNYELYKLLLYQEGDFFIPHRDTEKLDNMFATLVVVLPSEHQGGELIISHDGEQKQFHFGGKKSAYNIQYAAFYADCKHEIKPVESGYRLCLIYNLALVNCTQQPLAPEHHQSVKEITGILKNWVTQYEQEKLAVLFEHHYSQAGLSLTGLKNLDKVQASVLFKAAQAAGCKAHLALLTLWESGSAEGGGYYDYDYGHTDDSYEMDEVFDSTFTVNHWLDGQGIVKDFGEIHINENEIVAETGIGEGAPDEEDIEGPTGNAGATMERWYRRAALLLWPRQHHFAVVSQAGQKHTVPQLQLMLQQATDAEQAQCQRFAKAIIGHWRPTHPVYRIKQENFELNMLFDMLIDMDDVGLIKLFLNNILLKEFSGMEGKQLVTICRCYGIATFEPELSMMSLETKFPIIVAFAQIQEQLCYQINDSDTTWHSICRTIAANTLDSLKQWSVDATNHYQQETKESKISLLESLFKALASTNETALANDLLVYLRTNDQKFKIRPVLIPVVKNLQSWLADQNISFEPSRKLFEHCLNFLKISVATLIKKPQDWFQDRQLSCKCSDCRELDAFLKDRKTQVYRFKVKKDRRQHLHQQIEKHHCDMTHETQRVGSPQTLVCTKTLDTYQNQVKQQQLDIETLAMLKKLHSL